MVPSYSRSSDFLRVEGCVHSRLPSASSTKLATVLGASLSNRRHTMVPSLVSNLAYSPACRVMNLLSWFRKFGGLQITNVGTTPPACLSAASTGSDLLAPWAPSRLTSSFHFPPRVWQRYHRARS